LHGNEEEAGESSCSEETANSFASSKPKADQVDVDNPTLPLRIDDTAKMIQQWFCELRLYNRQTAALVITKAMCTNTKVTKAKRASHCIHSHSNLYPSHASEIEGMCLDIS
jgi:hypothetical protein